MKKIQYYTSENDFSQKETFLEEDQIELTNKIYNSLDQLVYGPILVKEKDPEALTFGVNLEFENRANREIGTRLYSYN